MHTSIWSGTAVEIVCGQEIAMSVCEIICLLKVLHQDRMGVGYLSAHILPRRSSSFRIGRSSSNSKVLFRICNQRRALTLISPKLPTCELWIFFSRVFPRKKEKNTVGQITECNLDYLFSIKANVLLKSLCELDQHSIRKIIPGLELQENVLRSRS